MANISYDIPGDISIGRGQLGLTDFITLSIANTQLWIDAAIDRPHRYFIAPNGINNTVKLPPIGSSDNQAQVGHSIMVKNTGVIGLNIQDSSGGAITSLTAGSAIMFTAQSATTVWQIVTFGSGGGEVNTASNVGLSGVGLFKQKTGFDLEFKNIDAGSSKIIITNDIINSTVDIDVDETQIPINNLSGILAVPGGGTGVSSLTSGNVLVGNGILPVLTTKAAPSGDFVGTTDVQALTNKTITDVTNIVVATDLRTTTGVVNVSAAAAPSAGQVLTATSGTAATWQTPGGGSGMHLASYTLVAARMDASNLVYSTASSFTWDNSRYNTYTGGTVVYSAIILGAKTLDIRLQDVTNNVTLGSVTGIAVNTIGSFSVINPGGDANVELQIRRSVAGGANPYILGVSLEYNY